ncbi:MAG TPA: hypothetical protein VLZ74_16010 [Methylocella sp.]|nr:hypothetical protein [Methylocella sp.]
MNGLTKDGRNRRPKETFGVLPVDLTSDGRALRAAQARIIKHLKSELQRMIGAVRTKASERKGHDRESTEREVAIKARRDSRRYLM